MSHLRIFPPVATVYPNDRQLFTAEAEPPPALWSNVLNSGDIQSDFSLQVDAAESQVAGNGGHALASGIGAIEMTIDNQCLPTSTNTLVIAGFITDINGTRYVFSVNIAATTVKVFDENNTEISTESYSTVAGDVYKIELAAGFRLYRKNAGATDFTLKFSRVGLGTTVIYPMTYQCVLTENTVTGPSRIPAPKLIGDWNLSAAGTLVWTGTHGSLTTAAGPQTEFFGGTTPGRHSIAVTLEGSALQQATAIVDIPPLQILGETTVTLQPGEKVRFKTNYDAAQTKLITWSVVAGPGSFTQDEFTAGTLPGRSVVRATASVNGLSADITVNVPATITNPNSYTAAKVSEEIDFATNLPLAPYFVSAGVARFGTGAIAPDLPLGIQPGDILLLPVETGNEAVTTPTGFASVADSPQGTGTPAAATACRLTALWKRAIAGEATPVIADPGDHVIGQILAFRGCIGSGNPWDVTAGNVEATQQASVSIPGDTTTVANTLVVLAVANQTDTVTPQTSGFTNADLTNLTERTDVNTTSGTGGGFAVATGEKAAIGSYGATTATLANASTQGRMSIALKPGTITWSASIGSIVSSTGVWTAPSLAGQVARITVTDGVTSLTIEVPVLEVFPFTDLSLPINRDRNLTALISMSEDRTRRSTREKSPPHDSYEVKLTARSLANVQAVDAFFDSHGFGKMFILDDAVRGVRKVGWFDSAIRHESRDECDNDISFRFLEARL